MPTETAVVVEPIGRVRAARTEVRDDDWGGSESIIVLDDSLPAEALDGIEEFSHVEVIFHLDRVPEENIERGARHPRNNHEWPRVGVFAQRTKNRPNRLAATICRVVSRSGRELVVAELDAIDGTPVLDLKPVLREFLPREEVRQPRWASELMARYWAPEAPPGAGE